MYDKIVVTRKITDSNGNTLAVTLGFFDARGILQLEVPQISGKLFPADVRINKSVVFNHPARISEIKK